MKQYLRTLVLLSLVLLLAGCARRLDSWLEEAERKAAGQKPQEALVVYSMLLKDAADYEKLHGLGFETGDGYKATKKIMVSLEKTIPTESERLNLLIAFIETGASDLSYLNTSHVLQYVLEAQTYSGDSRRRFLERYLEVLDEKDDTLRRPEGIDFLADDIATSLFPVREKIELITALVQGMDPDKYLGERLLADRSLPRTGVDNGYLKSEFQTLIERRVKTKAVAADNIEGILDPASSQMENELSEKFKRYELLPDLAKYTLRARAGYRLGKFLPVDLLRPKDEYNSDEYRVSQLFYLISVAHQPRREAEVEQLVLLKTVKIKEGNYVSEEGDFRGFAFMPLIQLYVYDLHQNAIIDVKTFIGGEAPEKVTVYNKTAESRGVFRYGKTPIVDAYHYLMEHCAE